MKDEDKIEIKDNVEWKEENGKRKLGWIRKSNKRKR